MGVSKNGWFIVENAIKTIKMDDLGVPLFQKPPYVDFATIILYFWVDTWIVHDFATIQSVNQRRNEHIEQISCG